MALVQAIPDQLFAAPAGTSGNFALGGYDPRNAARAYVMYLISGGGYGGNAARDGMSNGCSTIGISKTTPIEVMEQYLPGAVPRNSRCTKARAAPASIAAASASTTPSSCGAARRAPPW